MKKPLPKSKKRKVLLRTTALGIIALALASLVVVRYFAPSSQRTILAKSSPTPTATAAINQPAAGKTSGRGPGQTPAPSTSASPPAPVSRLIKPVGQLLNKGTISLSAGPGDSQHNSAMVSTIISASPGSGNTIVATDANGATILLGKPITADANGQGGEIDWDAKVSGLHIGVWKIQIQSQLSGSSTLSDPAQLTVGS